MAARSVSGLFSLTTECTGCGRASTIHRKTLRSLYAKGYRTFGQLWEHAYCPSCRETNQPYKIILRAEWVGVIGEQVTVLPAKPPVRATPQLPRRRLYA